MQNNLIDKSIDLIDKHFPTGSFKMTQIIGAPTQWSV